MQLKHLAFLSAVFSTATILIAQEVYCNVTYDSLRGMVERPERPRTLRTHTSRLNCASAINSLRPQASALPPSTPSNTASSQRIARLSSLSSPTTSPHLDGVIALSTTNLMHFVSEDTYVHGYDGLPLRAALRRVDSPCTRTPSTST
ncbi:hypothetical protein B0H12DRAFT_819750 [Mycena haematopus]|nr:hypothetical protein B0H12DRAFT_819750 [Mycena haematopus]